MENSDISISSSSSNTSTTNSSSAILRHQLIGQIIAEKYKVTRLLGRGGMGAVYEGQHLLLEKQIAIKVMSAELAEDKAALSRFIREAKTAARLEHPNAVTIHDFGIWQDTTAYIVMEYINGISLRDWLSENKVVPPLQAIKWLLQTCSAVAAAHDCGIIHRDLKPENIMLKEAGDNEHLIKVVDFGLAKVIKDEEASTNNLTKTGEVFGTPYYMGPEFYDNEVVDHRADIYALGVITYEMLSGRPPFYGTIEKIIAAHLFQEAKPLATVTGNPDLEIFDELIAKALKKKKEQRLSSASEFAKELKAILTSSSFSASQEAKTLHAIDFLPTNPQKSDATTASQILTGIGAQQSGINVSQKNIEVPSIPPTFKFSSGQVENLESLGPAKTLQNNLATTKISPTTQMSINDEFAPTLSDTNSQQTIVALPTQVISQPSNKKVPLAIGIAAVALIGVGGAWYELSNKTSTAPINNSISAPSTRGGKTSTTPNGTKAVIQEMPDPTSENKDTADNNGVAKASEDTQTKDTDKNRINKKPSEVRKRSGERTAKNDRNNEKQSKTDKVIGFLGKIIGKGEKDKKR